MPKFSWFNLRFTLPQPLKKAIPFLLFFTAIGINMYFRLFPAYFPQLERQAKFNVENRDIEAITKKVESIYPDFNQLIKKKIILKTFEEDKKNTAGFKKEIQEEYKKLKDPYQNESGQTYILEVDGYQWMRYVENILKNGHPGTSLKGGYPYDDYMLAPSGETVMPNQFFFYLSAFLYRVATFFLKNIPLMSFLFFLPLFYAFIFLAALYLIVRTFFSDLAAFFSVIFVGLNRVVLFRSCAGWFDYDSLTFALALIVVWSLSLSFRSKYTLKRRLFYSFFSAFIMAVYFGIWIGYWWIFGICAAYYFYTIANTYSLNKGAHKEAIIHIYLAVVFFVSSLVLCSFMSKSGPLNDIYFILEKISTLGTSQQTSVWPYTFYTVGELSKASPEQIVRNLGGSIIFVFVTVGALWVYIKERRTEKKDFVGLMIFWLFVMCFAASKGYRFVVFLVIPLGIFFGAFIEDIFKHIRHKLNKKPIIFFISLSVFFVFILWTGKTMLNSARAEAVSIYPIVNDSWYKALVYIDKNTPKNSIVNTWWDYGNFLKTVSGRRVVFDPQSQHTNSAYWMSQVILAQDEAKALNILRMLDNSSNTLFDEMQKEIKDNFECISLLNKILASNETEAKTILDKQSISKTLKNKIIETVFSKKPAPAYFFVDKSMIYKMSNISFLGNWDFSRLYMMRNRNLPKEQIIENLEKMFSLSKDQATNVYTEVILSTTEDESNEALSRRYSFPFFIDKAKEEGNFIYFNNGVILNTFDRTARILSMDGGYLKFKNVFIFDNNKLNFYECKDTDYNSSIFFLKSKNGWQAIGLSKELAHSLFVKLYFLNGEGSKYFEPFYSDSNGEIYIYKINW
ncbi:MAG: STT3 domain-containing protein [Candidatus Omnitrophota bacterium]